MKALSWKHYAAVTAPYLTSCIVEDYFRLSWWFTVIGSLLYVGYFLFQWSRN